VSTGLRIAVVVFVLGAALKLAGVVVLVFWRAS
jgi:hypothetical protein